MKGLPLLGILIILLAGCRTRTDKEDSMTTLSGDQHNLTKQILVNSKPDSINVDIERKAVIVVDMENDFCSKGGLMDKFGIDLSVIQNIISPTKAFLASARKAAIPIIYLKMGYKPDLSDLGAKELAIRERFYGIVGDTIASPNGAIGRLLIRDTWNTDIISEIKPQTNDIVIYKTRFSGFYQTQLDSILKSKNIKFLIIVGCTTSVCVESTVRDAMFRDYFSIVLEDCTAEPDGFDLARSNHEASLFIIQSELGWVSNSREFIKVFSSVVH
jgi:ureidoacrylate peracid hydrolase